MLIGVGATLRAGGRSSTRTESASSLLGPPRTQVRRTAFLVCNRRLSYGRRSTSMTPTQPPPLKEISKPTSSTRLNAAVSH